jgi:hypothetical protein
VDVGLQLNFAIFRRDLVVCLVGHGGIVVVLALLFFKLLLFALLGAFLRRLGLLEHHVVDI